MLAIALARRNNNYTTQQNNQINTIKKMKIIQKENKFLVAIFKSRQKK